MAADDLATQGARASATMIFTMWNQMKSIATLSLHGDISAGVMFRWRTTNRWLRGPRVGVHAENTYY